MQNEQEEIKSKPTLYDGYNFRSRNEAKWAAFFNYMGIEYKYESRDVYGYRRVLPDFYLPKMGVFVEIKHDMFTEDARETHTQKYSVIPSTTGKPCMIAYGDPRQCTTSRDWNKSVLIFNAIHATASGEVYPSDDVGLYRARCWFATLGVDDYGFYGATELATDIDKNRFHIVSKINDEWVKQPCLAVSNGYNRNVEQVALFARQFQFEYVEEHPLPDTGEADEEIAAVWRSKYPPKPVYAGTGYGASPTPLWAK